MADNYVWRGPHADDDHHHHHHHYAGGPPPEFYFSGYLEKTSSFDSHGSPRMIPSMQENPNLDNYKKAVQTIVGDISYGYAPIPYPPPFNPYFHQYHSPPPQIINVEYITELNPNDVLCGRGGATNSYAGNRNFRKLVKSHQEMYLNAKKRDKPSVASKIVQIIRDSGGRFLSRCNNKNARTVVWVDIGDDRAREKTCQALREGAPEIRRRNILASPREDPAASPQPEQSSSNRLSPPMSNLELIKSPQHHVQEAPIVVRPWKLLLPQRTDIHDIELDQLSDFHRELYLRDFLPPNPDMLQ